jgi:hypothetical protein
MGHKPKNQKKQGDLKAPKKRIGISHLNEDQDGEQKMKLSPKMERVMLDVPLLKTKSEQPLDYEWEHEE